MSDACPGGGYPPPPLLAQNIHLFCPRGHPLNAWKSHLRGKNSKIRLALSALKHAYTTVKLKLEIAQSEQDVSPFCKESDITYS